MSKEANRLSSPVISRGLATDNGLAQTIPCGSGDARPASAIQVVKEGEVIQAINVHCRCGEIIKVVCKYE